MSDTLAQLGQLLLGTIPTILIFGALHFFLKRVLYAPLRAVLAERAQLTEGRLALARQSTEAAEAKWRQYEDAIRQARAEGYRGIEARRQDALTAAGKELAEAREHAAAAITQAQQQLDAEATQAQETLRQSSAAIAAQVAARVLGGAQQGVNAV